MNEVLGIDPGLEKCGIAVCGAGGELLYHEVAALDDLPEAVERALAGHFCQVCALGDGTGSDHVKQVLVSRFAPTLRIVDVDEENTTLEARELYFQENPPRWLARLVPKGMRMPPGQIDDYAAWAIALKHLAGEAESKGQGNG